MNILHLISGKANPDRANGVNQVVYGLAKYMSLAGHEVRVLGISRNTEVDHEVIDRQYFQVEVYRRFLMSGFRRFRQLAAECDIIHLHGTWSGMNILAGRYCESIGKPYVVTAHCTYSEDRIRQSSRLMKLAWHYLFQKHLYEKAAAIHALTREEMTDITRYCRNPYMFVVPNGVDWEKVGLRQYELHQGRSQMRLGYLGRLAKEKNLSSLIEALTLLPEPYRNQVELWLIGPLAEDAQALQVLTRSWGLERVVHFVGAKYGEDKTAALLDLDAYIHPACSEGFSIAVAESLSLGLPAVVTRTSNVSYFASTGAFIMCEPTAADLARGIVELLGGREQWMAMSDKARELCHATFNWERSAAALIQHYRAVCEKS